MASTVPSRRPQRFRCVEALLACLALSACEPTPPPAAQAPVVTPLAPAATALATATATPPAPSTVAPPPVPAAPTLGPLTEAEIDLFDRMVADEILFPRASERERYERLEPETIKDQHHVGFELKQQPGMKKGRHFHLIDVAVARAGTYVTRRSSKTKLNGSAGQGGSSIEFAAQTKDGAYDIRVSQGMLLVRPMKAPQFDPERVALALVDRYDQLRANPRSTN